MRNSRYYEEKDNDYDEDDSELINRRTRTRRDRDFKVTGLWGLVTKICFLAAGILFLIGCYFGITNTVGLMQSPYPYMCKQISMSWLYLACRKYYADDLFIIGSIALVAGVFFCFARLIVIWQYSRKNGIPFLVLLSRRRY